MSFIKPLITATQNINSGLYYSVCWDERYKGLMEALDIPKPAPTAERYTYYCTFLCSNIRCVLMDCISKGDGTPAQLKYLKCTDNMKRYRQSVPAFRYNTAVFPPYGDTKHHWYISTLYNHVSLITDSKQEILDDISNTSVFTLEFCTST